MRILGEEATHGRSLLHAGLLGYNDAARTLTVGIVNELIMTIVWTQRNQSIRIISARRTRDAETGK